jgi:hypothetical protein
LTTSILILAPATARQTGFKLQHRIGESRHGHLRRASPHVAV